MNATDMATLIAHFMSLVNAMADSKGIGLNLPSCSYFTLWLVAQPCPHVWIRATR